MRRTTWITHAVLVAALVLGACGTTPREETQLGLPAEPIASEGVTTNPTPAPELIDPTGPIATTATTSPASLKATPETRVVGNPQISRSAGRSGEYSYVSGAHPSAPEPVGPAASYDDYADDANGGAGGAAGSSQAAPLSQPSFDILSVAWSPVSYSEPSRRGYSTSIRIAGPAHPDGAYVTYGRFTSDGQNCELYNILEVGVRAYANAFCGSVYDGTRRFLGRMDGRLVTSSGTADGGTTLVGTFDDPTVPTELQAYGRKLYDLAAFTAMCSPGPDGCRVYDNEMDWVSSPKTFRV